MSGEAVRIFNRCRDDTLHPGVLKAAAVLLLSGLPRFPGWLFVNRWEFSEMEFPLLLLRFPV
jgi:hypothetical protein